MLVLRSARSAMLTSRARMRSAAGVPTGCVAPRTQGCRRRNSSARQVHRHRARRRRRRSRRRRPRRRRIGRSRRASISASGPLATTRPSVQHHQVVGQPRHFVGRVADVEHGNVQFVVQAFEVGQDLLLAREVERGQRLVHQQQRGLVSSARAMATRWRSPPESRSGLALEQVADAEQFDDLIAARRGARAAATRFSRTPGCARTERCGNRLASWNT